MLYVNSNLRKIQIDDCIKFVSHSAYQMQVSLYESEIGISIHMHASYKVLQLSFWTLFVPSLLWLFHLYTHRSLFADTPPCHCLWPEELFENTHFYCNCFAFTQSSLYVCIAVMQIRNTPTIAAYHLLRTVMDFMIDERFNFPTDYFKLFNLNNQVYHTISVYN